MGYCRGKMYGVIVTGSTEPTGQLLPDDHALSLGTVHGLALGDVECL